MSFSTKHFLCQYFHYRHHLKAHFIHLFNIINGKQLFLCFVFWFLWFHVKTNERNWHYVQVGGLYYFGGMSGADCASTVHYSSSSRDWCRASISARRSLLVLPICWATSEQSRLQMPESAAVLSKIKRLSVWQRITH